MSGNVPSFLSGSKNGKNGLGVSIRQNPRGKMKKKDLFSSFSYISKYLLFKSFLLKICAEYNIAAEFSTKFHNEKIRK